MPDGPDAVTIRDATPADAAVLADFNRRLALETESLDLDPATVERGVAAALADPAKGQYFVAELGGRVAGCLMVTREWSDWRDGEFWWIQSVYVAAEHRGRGVFRSLYAHVARLAEAAGAVGLRLYVERENAAALATYARLGMTRTHYRMMEVTF